MASLEAVIEGLTKMDVSGLAGQGARPLSDDEKLLRTQVYREQMADLSDADFKAAVNLAVGNRKPFYPTPGQLREFVRPSESIEAADRSAAQRAYERIVDDYSRSTWPDLNARGKQRTPCTSQRAIREQLGACAVEAYFAAGGDSTFSYCEPGTDETFRRKRFMEAYAVEAAALRAIGAALEAGADPDALEEHARPVMLGAGESAALVARIAALPEAGGAVVLDFEHRG